MKIKIEVPESIKNANTNEAMIHEVVKAQLSNKRSASAKTKTKGEVSGGGKKPWRQKGTGRARVGSNRSPIWRGGGVIFGPNGEQNYKKKVLKKKKKAALVQVLAQRISEDNLTVVDKIEISEPKTRYANIFLNEVLESSITKKTLIVYDENNAELMRYFRNIDKVSVSNYKDISVLELLSNDNILMAASTWEHIVKTRGLE